MLLIQHGGAMCLGPSRDTPKTLTVYEPANSYIATMPDGIKVPALLPISHAPAAASACPFTLVSENWQVVASNLYDV